MSARDKNRSPPPRPIKPKLAAAAVPLKSSPTPRLAAPFVQSPSGSSSPRRPLSTATAPGSSRSHAVEDDGTPGKKLLASNVTPRSAARNSRAGSTSSTPTKSATFFHAKDAPSQAESERPNLLKKAATFVYADGRRETGNAAALQSQIMMEQAPELNHLSNPPTKREKVSSPPSKDSQPPGAPSSPASSVSAPISWHVFSSMSPRPPSPPKQNFHLSYRKGASQIIPPNTSTQAPQSTSPQQQRRLSSLASLRQLSLDATSEPTDLLNHVASAFNGKQDASDLASPLTPRSPGASQPMLSMSPERLSQDTSFTQPPVNYTRAESYTVANSVATNGFSEETTTSSDAQRPEHSLAATARRERKVLDLEISNSSLLAINRSLEREIRKQKAEIHRLKRLSRNSTRPSWLSEAMSLSAVEDYSSDDTGLDPEEGEQSELDVQDDCESLSDQSMSPSVVAEHDARHLREDEKRLRLDLAKHREILIDSQKMNLSLKRCLGLSDQLIKDCSKALEYQVKVTDVQLGGRVLSPEEVEISNGYDEDEEEYFTGKWMRESDRLSAASQRLLLESDHGTDKDSGVDLEYSRRSEDVAERDRVDSLTLSEAEREMF